MLVRDYVQGETLAQRIQRIEALSESKAVATIIGLQNT